MVAQFAAIALALMTAAGSVPSFCGIPIGCSCVRKTCGVPGSKRAADQVVQGGEANTTTQLGDAA
eukprot:4273637-Pleurochrysis_carterae.AAC.1